MPRLAIVVDEFAALATELPGFMAGLVDIAQRGRSLGVHLVLATQRPAGVVNETIRANTNLRVALRVQTVADSVDVIGAPDAAGLDRLRPGRAVLRIGHDAVIPFQTALVSASTRRRRSVEWTLRGEAGSGSRFAAGRGSGGSRTSGRHDRRGISGPRTPPGAPSVAGPAS